MTIPVWRTGSRNGRTIYLQRGDEPSKDDAMIGAMDTAEMSALVVECVNRHYRQGVEHERARLD